MRPKSPRVAVRAVIVQANKLLLVNAWPGGRSALLCAPGGGVVPGCSLPENLAREVFEETGLKIDVGALCLVNEFHDPQSGYHQVEVFFRCRVIGQTQIASDWKDPENIVSRHVWASDADFERLQVKPDSLRQIAFHQTEAFSYDPLETIVL
ncbi:MAG: NUDIX hydrolase [Roseobacter sp.]|jgi:8-oxo-dGTP pyrophosphatase MutT (NUDIX family)